MSFQTFFSNAWTAIATFFKADVLPEAEAIEQAFLAQFKTPGGQLVFAAVTAFMSAIPGVDGITDIVAVGKTILGTLAAQELELAGHDAEQVVLDAIRVHMSAATATASTTATQVA